MFRDRIIYWARILNLFTSTMGTFVVLARARVSPLMFTRTYQDKAATHQMNVNLQRDHAIAYMQISRLNR